MTDDRFKVDRDYHWYSVNCFTCGKSITRIRSELDRRKRSYCSRACYYQARRDGVYTWQPPVFEDV